MPTTSCRCKARCKARRLRGMYTCAKWNPVSFSLAAKSSSALEFEQVLSLRRYLGETPVAAKSGPKLGHIWQSRPNGDKVWLIGCQLGPKVRRSVVRVRPSLARIRRVFREVARCCYIGRIWCDIGKFGSDCCFQLWRFGKHLPKLGQLTTQFSGATGGSTVMCVIILNPSSLSSVALVPYANPLVS